MVHEPVTTKRNLIVLLIIPISIIYAKHRCLVRIVGAVLSTRLPPLLVIVGTMILTPALKLLRNRRQTMKRGFIAAKD